MILLLDGTERSLQRLNALQPWEVRLVTSPHEIIGLHPDLLLIDESQGLGAIAELSEMMDTVVLADRVTISLRRSCSNAMDIITHDQLIEFMTDQMEPIVSVSAEEARETAATTEVEHVASTQTQPSLQPAWIPKRGATVIGFGPLRTTSGGVGKTTICYNVAAYYAKQGKRVLIIDLDPTGVMADMAGAQGNMNTLHWENLMQQKVAHMSETAILEATETTKYGFQLIASPEDRQDTIQPDLLNFILEKVSPFFDAILMDIPGFMTPGVAAALKSCDTVYLIGRHDRAHYRRYKQGFDVYKSPFALGVKQENLRIVLNLAYKLKNKEIEKQEIGKQLNTEVTDILPEDDAVKIAREQGKAVIIETPNCPFSKALMNVVEPIQSNLPTISQPGAAPKKESFWKRLGGRSKNKKAVGR